MHQRNDVHGQTHTLPPDNPSCRGTLQDASSRRGRETLNFQRLQKEPCVTPQPPKCLPETLRTHNSVKKMCGPRRHLSVLSIAFFPSTLLIYIIGTKCHSLC